MQHPRPISAVRPLVRYVDSEQAVIELHVTTRPHHLPAAPRNERPPEVWMQITGTDGFYDEQRAPLTLDGAQGRTRFDIVEPQRWWPAGMGDQPLYEMTLTLVHGDAQLDAQSVTLGLTSVRPDVGGIESDKPHLLVNGEICVVRTVLPVDSVDERQLLPATGDSLLLVRDHYGPDVLYQAADRAGILLVQSVPIHPRAEPEREVARQVDRLAAHPSLAGWFVGHLGRLSDRVAQRLRRLDPTRSVFRDFPVQPAA